MPSLKKKLTVYHTYGFKKFTLYIPTFFQEKDFFKSFKNYILNWILDTVLFLLSNETLDCESNIELIHLIEVYDERRKKGVINGKERKKYKRGNLQLLSSSKYVKRKFSPTHFLMQCVKSLI
jgi:hypothetical protein